MFFDVHSVFFYNSATHRYFHILSLTYALAYKFCLLLHQLAILHKCDPSMEEIEVVNVETVVFSEPYKNTKKFWVFTLCSMEVMCFRKFITKAKKSYTTHSIHF